ncbi:MAG: pilus assembly protein PilM, partial [Erysipelotrichaceae bacterium]
MPLSIEIRARQLQVVQTTVTKSRVHYKNTFSVDLEEGWVDSKGIVNQAAIVLALNQVLESKGIKESKCTLCINNHSVIYRELMIPKIEDKRIPFVVKSEMIAALDLTTDHIVDFIILEEITVAHKTTLRVLAVAIAQGALGSYVDFCLKLGTKPDAIDTAISSVIKLVEKSDLCKEGEPTIIADVENDVMRLYLFENKKYILIRNTKLSEVDEDKKTEWISDIEDSINKMMQYQFTRESHTGIEKIFFFGSHPLLTEIQETVKANLLIETSLYPKPDFLSR